MSEFDLSDGDVESDLCDGEVESDLCEVESDLCDGEVEPAGGRLCGRHLSPAVVVSLERQRGLPVQLLLGGAGAGRLTRHRLPIQTEEVRRQLGDERLRGGREGVRVGASRWTRVGSVPVSPKEDRRRTGESETGMGIMNVEPRAQGAGCVVMSGGLGF